MKRSNLKSIHRGKRGKNTYLFLLNIVGILVLFMSACNFENKGNTEQSTTQPAAPTSNATTLAVAHSIVEDFELGGKGSYATGSLKLKSGEWEFNNVMLGSEKNDLKNGNKAARFKKDEPGSLTMLYDIHETINTISVSHALYANDVQPATWELRASTNGGKTWTKVGNTITCSSHSLLTQEFKTNFSGAVRLGIFKLSGGRLNIDDLSINPQANQSPVASNTTDTETDAENPLALGNPSGATPDNTNNLLLKKKVIL